MRHLLLYFHIIMIYLHMNRQFISFMYWLWTSIYQTVLCFEKTICFYFINTELPIYNMLKRLLVEITSHYSYRMAINEDLRDVSMERLLNSWTLIQNLKPWSDDHDLSLSHPFPNLNTTANERKFKVHHFPLQSYYFVDEERTTNLPIVNFPMSSLSDLGSKLRSSASGSLLRDFFRTVINKINSAN